MGVYETPDGQHLIASTPLTDAELRGWIKHRDTFFGEVRQVAQGVNNWLALAKFFYESYQHTPREKLLEWLKGAQDFNELATLSQRELAISYCERAAWAAERDRKVA